MATNSRNLTRKGSILPQGVTKFIQKRAIETIGVALIIAALAMTTALGSFNPAAERGIGLVIVLVILLGLFFGRDMKE